MEDEFPTEYDVIVVGTGMTESIVAAAASRMGKKVLHIDSNEYYGGLWATFNFDGLQKWIKDLKAAELDGFEDDLEDSSSADDINKICYENNIEIEKGETYYNIKKRYCKVKNIEDTWFIINDADLPELSSKDTQTESTGESKATDASEKTDDEKSENKDGVKHWTIDRIKKEYRRFNIDLAPKLLFAKGELAELLISSNISRYAEFRAVSRIATYIDGKLVHVPCSRTDVFETKTVSVVEKRMLMQLLISCMEQGADSPEFDGFQDKTFLEYLSTKDLTPIVKHYVLRAIAMATDKTSCRDGVNRTKHFLNSLGRFGNTPFLWPMYGSGELPQCFCRLSAVFEGIYCLKHKFKGIIVEGDKCKAIFNGEKRLALEHLVVGPGYLPPELVISHETQKISRGIFITDRSIMQGEKENLTLLYYPPEEPDQEPVTLIEVGPSTNACPQGLYIIHMTCKQTRTARQDLDYVVKKFLASEAVEPNVSHLPTDVHTQTSDKAHEGDKKSQEKDVENLKPRVLWSLYFNLPASDIELTPSAPKNLHLCSGPDLELDFDSAVNQAKKIFNTMYPGLSFLPRAPDFKYFVLGGKETPGPEGEDDPSEG